MLINCWQLLGFNQKMMEMEMEGRGALMWVFRKFGNSLWKSLEFLMEHVSSNGAREFGEIWLRFWLWVSADWLHFCANGVYCVCVVIV